jgi:hypothetical protein
MQLEQMKRAGIPYDQGVAKTHSVQYARTSIQQSGQTIIGVRIDTSRAFLWKLFGTPVGVHADLVRDP